MVRIKPVATERTPGQCMYEGCSEPSERLDGDDSLPMMWCAPHNAAVLAYDKQIQAMYPAYGRYMEGKED